MYLNHDTFQADAITEREALLSMALAKRVDRFGDSLRIVFVHEVGGVRDTDIRRARD